MVAQFDVMALASIALLALSLYQAWRNYDRKEMILSMVLLAVSLLQVAWVMTFMSPWGALDVDTWIVVTAGMMACLALGLLSMNLRDYAESASVVIALLALAQLLVGSGILMLPW